MHVCVLDGVDVCTHLRACVRLHARVCVLLREFSFANLTHQQSIGLNNGYADQTNPSTLLQRNSNKLVPLVPVL